MTDQGRHIGDVTVGHAAHEGPTVRRYVQIFVALFIITACEVATSFLIGVVPIWIPVGILLILMTIKGTMVVLFYMHLRFDSVWFTFLFGSGMILALGLALSFLALFAYKGVAPFSIGG